MHFSLIAQNFEISSSCAPNLFVFLVTFAVALNISPKSLPRFRLLRSRKLSSLSLPLVRTQLFPLFVVRIRLPRLQKVCLCRFRRAVVCTQSFSPSASRLPGSPSSSPFENVTHKRWWMAHDAMPEMCKIYAQLVPPKTSREGNFTNNHYIFLLHPSTMIPRFILLIILVVSW
uniref:Uncharacterized protein n=1 Tax=Cucumis melo TaxID=3656 RepID=A0A9I9EDH0_CUCME